MSQPACLLHCGKGLAQARFGPGDDDPARRHCSAFQKNIRRAVPAQAFTKVAAKACGIFWRTANGAAEQEGPILPRNKAGQVQFRLDRTSVG